jgi:hypothetical protein
VSKVVIAYGAVFAVNVFLIMVPIINGFAIGSILKMLLLVGGGLSISGGTLLFARLFGTDAAESRDLAQSARTILAGGAAGIAGVKWATAKAGGTTGKVWTGANKTVSGAARLFGYGKNSGTMDGSNSGNFMSKVMSMGNSGSNIMSSAKSLGNGAYNPAPSPQSLPGSPLGVAMATAGVQRGTWNRDIASGRFVTADKAAAIEKSFAGSNSGGGSGSNIGSNNAQTGQQGNRTLQNRMKFKNPTKTDNKRS